MFCVCEHSHCVLVSEHFQTAGYLQLNTVPEWMNVNLLWTYDLDFLRFPVKSNYTDTVNELSLFHLAVIIKSWKCSRCAWGNRGLSELCRHTASFFHSSAAVHPAAHCDHSYYSTLQYLKPIHWPNELLCSLFHDKSWLINYSFMFYQ